MKEVAHNCFEYSLENFGWKLVAFLKPTSEIRLLVTPCDKCESFAHSESCFCIVLLVGDSSFKDAMAKVPTSVFVVGVHIEGLVVGCTISSVVSVDIERQVISFVLQKNSSTLIAIKSKNEFGISLLSNQQSEVSRYFSNQKKSLDQGEFVWDLETQSVPFIPNNAGSFHCSLDKIYELDNTTIVLAKVENFKVTNEGSPLMYWNRTYFSLNLE